MRKFIKDFVHHPIEKFYIVISLRRQGGYNDLFTALRLSGNLKKDRGIKLNRDRNKYDNKIYVVDSSNDVYIIDWFNKDNNFEYIKK